MVIDISVVPRDVVFFVSGRMEAFHSDRIIEAGFVQLPEEAAVSVLLRTGEYEVLTRTLGYNNERSLISFSAAEVVERVLLIRAAKNDHFLRFND